MSEKCNAQKMNSPHICRHIFMDLWNTMTPNILFGIVFVGLTSNKFGQPEKKWAASCYILDITPAVSMA